MEGLTNRLVIKLESSLSRFFSNDAPVKPVCPLVVFGESLKDSVEACWGEVKKMMDESTGLEASNFSLHCEVGQQKTALLLTVTSLSRQIKLYKDEILQDGESARPLHQDVAQACASTQALKYALAGRLSEVGDEELDKYFPKAEAQEMPAHSSWGCRAVTTVATAATGLGCLILGLGAAGSGKGIAHHFVDDKSGQDTIAHHFVDDKSGQDTMEMEIIGGGIALSALGVGLGVGALWCAYRQSSGSHSDYVNYDEEQQKNTAVAVVKQRAEQRTLLEKVDISVRNSSPTRLLV